MVALGLSLTPALLIGCQEQLPVGPSTEALPGGPVTIEITLPWSEFASNLEVFGGYGAAVDLGQGVLANQFAGSLDARTLMRFNAYPAVANVQDTTGTTRPDSTLSYFGGRLVAFLDTVASTTSGPVDITVGILQNEWDATTVSWAFAVDTINDQRAWPEAGGGPVIPVDTATWDPAAGDSVVFVLDSATVAAWGDPDDLSTGARFDLLDMGSRIQVNGAALRLNARPSSNPDTIIELIGTTSTRTFIYSPFPDPPPDGVRIAGAPSWRTILDVSIPDTIDGIPEFCAVVSCPHVLIPGEISFAALTLTSSMTEVAFQPTDTIRLDVRPVLNRSVMPKSPLGPSLIAQILGRPVGPDAFGAGAGVEIEIPFTSFARDLLRGTDESGEVTTNTLALLSIFEPISISFASFEGPGSAAEPTLKLVLTIGPPVELP